MKIGLAKKGANATIGECLNPEFQLWMVNPRSWVRLLAPFASQSISPGSNRGAHHATQTSYWRACPRRGLGDTRHQPGPSVDHVSDAGDLACFSDDTFAQVYASHVLEHFDYMGTMLAALKEWKRVMVPGGTLYVSVPDLDVLARLFLDRELLSYQDRFMAMRMIFGGHIDKSDYHLVGLNQEFLTDVLRIAGFTGDAKSRHFRALR